MDVESWTANEEEHDKVIRILKVPINIMTIIWKSLSSIHRLLAVGVFRGSFVMHGQTG